MKISKAIEILEKWEEPKSVFDVGELEEAKQLGIEALKRVKEKRRYGIAFGAYHLPGESPERETGNE